MISGNMVGSYSQMGKTFILMDEDGNEIAGVVVDQETVFTAGDNDVREGLVYASDNGVSIGTKDIPAYRTTQGVFVVFSGDDFTISLPSKYNVYDYTQLQCIIAPFNTNLEDSVASDKIVLHNKVYPINSLTALSNVTKDEINKSIKLNINNNTENDYIIYYFTYREEM